MENIAITEYLKDHLSETRLAHTQRVLLEAQSLAKVWHVDRKQAELAALSHDMVRNLDPNELDRLIEKWELPETLLGNRNLSHGRVAGAMLKHNFGIDDQAVLDAVSYHTTGRAGMGLLEKVIYIADAIEPGRSYPGVDVLRQLAYKDLNLACIKSMEHTISYVNERGETLSMETVHALEDLRKLKGIPMENREIALKTAQMLLNKKASDVVVIDIATKSSFTDYLVIATGGSERQIGTLTQEVVDQLAKDGIFAKNIEGKKSSGWILLDYGDILVNLFTLEQRSRYNIEKIWGDGIFLDIEETN